MLLIGLGAILMLGKFTFLFDRANQIPVLGSSREPVRFHLWVALGVAALAAVGVERLARPGAVSLRGGLILAGVLVVLSIPIMIYIYTPVWTEPEPLDRAVSPRPISLAGPRADAGHDPDDRPGGAGLVGRPDRRARDRPGAPGAMGRGAAAPGHGRPAGLALVRRPHGRPRYWTEPPETVRRLKADPASSASSAWPTRRPASRVMPRSRSTSCAVRDPLDWSLPLVWHLPTSRGNTPMIPAGCSTSAIRPASAGRSRGGHDLEGDTHILPGEALEGAEQGEDQVGAA